MRTGNNEDLPAPFPMIFSKKFLEGHSPPDISVGRGVGKRGITPSLDSGGGGKSKIPPLDLL